MLKVVFTEKEKCVGEDVDFEALSHPGEDTNQATGNDDSGF